MPRREPLPKVLRRRRAVGAQVAAADLTQAFLLVHFFPALDPLVRTGERDLASLRRPLTEDGAAEEREPRQQTPSCLRSHALHDFGGEFFAQETAAVERFQHCGAYLLDVIASERRVQFAFRIDPGFQFFRFGRRHCAAGRVPERQLHARMEVERSAQRPRLHELATFPEGFADILLRDPFEARGELKLGRRLNLRVHAAEVVDDFEQTVGAGPRRQEAALETARANLSHVGNGLEEPFAVDELAAGKPGKRAALEYLDVRRRGVVFDMLFPVLHEPGADVVAGVHARDAFSVEQDRVVRHQPPAAAYATLHWQPVPPVLPRAERVALGRASS